MAEFDKDINVRSNEYINKAELDELFSRYGLNPKHYCKPFNQIFPSFAMDKEILPTIDIVTCRDCKHYGTEDDYNMCNLTRILRDDDWFCADGERRTK